MAAINAKALRNALRTFFKENGREPDFKEFKQMVLGESLKEEKAENK